MIEPSRRQYEMALPAEVRRILSVFTWGVSFGLASTTDVLTCMGLDGFVPRLTFWIVMPLVLVAAIFTSATVLLLWEQRRASTDDERGLTLAKMLVRNMLDRELRFPRRLLQAVLPVVLRLIFLSMRLQLVPRLHVRSHRCITSVLTASVYPLVCNAAFEGLSCYEFYKSESNGFASLIADVSITCSENGETTEEYGSVLLMAWATVGAYAFGLVVISAALLLAASNAIIKGKPTSLSRGIRFLYSEARSRRSSARGICSLARCL